MKATIKRNTPDGITRLQNGDMVTWGNITFQLLKVEKGWIRHEAVVRFSKERTIRSIRMDDTFANLSPGDSFKYGTGMSGVFLGEVQFREASVKVISPGFQGVPGKDDLKYKNLVLCLDDPQGLWDTLRADNRKNWQDFTGLGRSFNEMYVDMGKATVTPGVAPIVALANTKGFTKYDLIPYVVGVNGPMDKVEILRQVAALEGKPFIPTSNHGIFPGVPYKKVPGMVERGLLIKLDKAGNTDIYGIGPVGIAVAQKVIGAIGKEPAEKAKEKKG